jgi:single-stranded DNA-binding protein
MLINHITIAGRLVADAKLQTVGTSKGPKEMVTFNIAVNRGKNLPASFFKCIAWDKAAKYICVGKKGEEILIFGSLVQNKYEKDGRKYNNVQIVISGFCFPKKAIQSEEEHPDVTNDLDAAESINDDIPA